MKNLYDVAVIGGGFTGVGAALAAARGGAKVLLIEKSNCLGGAAAGNLVNPFMGYSTEINGEKVALSAGIFREIHAHDFTSLGFEKKVAFVPRGDYMPGGASSSKSGQFWRSQTA